MNSKDLKILQKKIQKASVLMASEVEYENAVVFFGYTKSGKSSLLNYIIDNELVGKRIDDFMPISINRVDNLFGPEIGLDATSKTIVPSRWESPEKLPGLALWDLPGYDDNRGPVQDIAGAYYIYELFRNVHSVKIVLIIDVNDITNNRINAFIDVLHSVESLLNGKMRENFSSIVVIFTKVPDEINDKPANKELIVKIINKQLSSSSDIKISETVKEYVQYLVKNHGNIGLFKKAKSGPITNEIEIDVTESIKNATSIGEMILKSVKPSIASKSKVDLFSVRQKLYSVEEFNRFQKTLNDIFCRTLKEFENVLENEMSKEILNSIMYQLKAQSDQLNCLLNSDDSFHTKINTLKTIVSGTENKLDVNKLLEISKLMEFTDALLDLKDSQQVNVNLQLILRQIVSKINKIIIDIQFKLKEIDRKEFEEYTEKLKENHVEEMEKLKEKLEEIKKHNETKMKELGIFARIGNAIDGAIQDIGTFFRLFF